MVYHGKPSMACSLCRIRKIKCDQIRPACSQCVRVSAECHGYRSPSDLIFRDQRPAVEQRAYLRAAAQLLEKNDDKKGQKLAKLVRAGSIIATVCHTPHLVRSLPTPESELVPSLFFQYFDVEDTASGHALASCLPQTISTADDDALSVAVSSVGYALLSNITKSSDKLIMARQKYGIAVRLTCNVIQTCVASETCWAVRVILILAFFELFTCTDPLSMTAWSIHLEGAATLLKTRGVDTSNCVLGRKGLKLFLQFRNQLLTNSLQRSLPVPDTVSHLSNGVKELMMPDELLSTELGDILIRLANFRAVMASRGPFDVIYSMPILLQLESDLKKWAIALPSSWRYDLHTCIPQGDFYTLYYHKYPGFSIAAVWNQYRIARCLVNDLLLTYLDSSPGTNLALHPLALLEQSDQVKDTIQNVCTDICASVPYFLRQMDQSNHPRPGVGALEVMWPLFTCASMHCIPEEQRLWAIKQLEKIGYGMGILQALTLANLARSKSMSVK